MVWNEAWKANIPVLKPIGDADDLWGAPDKTLLAYSNAAFQHIHMPGYVWPNDCTVVTATTSATANTFGDFVELVPVDGIIAPFDCHWVTVTAMSDTETYIVEFHVVDDTDLQTSVKYLTAFTATRLDNFTRSWQIDVQMPAIGGGHRIGTRAKKSGAGAGTIAFNIHYHEYE